MIQTGNEKNKVAPSTPLHDPAKFYTKTPTNTSTTILGTPKT